MPPSRSTSDLNPAPQALFGRQSSLFQREADASRQKVRPATASVWTSKRKPGAGFVEHVRQIFAPGGKAGCRHQSLSNNITAALWPCIFWLRRNPRYCGTFGRMPEAAFAAAFKANQPKSTAARWIRLLIAHGLIGYTEHHGRLFVDFACWEDAAAQAHYDRTKQANTDRRRVQRARAKPLFLAQQKPSWHGDPRRMPQNSPSDTFCGVSPLSLRQPRCSASPLKPAPQAARLFDPKIFKNGQHSNILDARPGQQTPGSKLVPSPNDKDVGHVGAVKKMNTKEGQVALASFLAMIPANVDLTAKPEPVQDPTLPPRAPRMPYSDIHRRMPVGTPRPAKPVQSLSREAVASANRNFGLSLNWSELKRAAFTDEHLDQAAHFVMRNDAAKLSTFGSLEAVVVNAAKMRALGYFGPKPTRQGPRRGCY